MKKSIEAAEKALNEAQDELERLIAWGITSGSAYDKADRAYDLASAYLCAVSGCV